MKLKILVLLATLFMTLTHQIATAAVKSYNVKLIFTDDTTFTGTFKYDAATQKITELKGLLDDVLMGDVVWLSKKLTSVKDGKGGISATVYALDTKQIQTDPPINNNAYVTINFNAKNPTLGATNRAKLAYMDCTPGAMMGQTCMYYLAWHKPVIPMSGGHGNLSIKITVMATSKSKVSRLDCLLNWAENNYSEFSPINAVSSTQLPSYYRYYPDTHSYLGISVTDSHLYYQGPDGSQQDWGYLADWFETSGCYTSDVQ